MKTLWRRLAAPLRPGSASRAALLLSALCLVSCGGGGDAASGGKSAPTYAVGGTLAGLASGTLVLSSGIDSVQITVDDGIVQDRAFQLAALPTGAAYDIRVTQQPAGAACTVVNGSAVVGAAPINNIQILCAKRKSLALVAGAMPAYGAQDGVGTQAGFRFPFGGSVAVDAAGNLIVADGTAVRKVTPSGIVATLAGIDGVQGLTDGKGVSARFGWLGGVVVDGNGIVHVADTGNDAIRRITPDGVVTTMPIRRAALGTLPVTGCVVCGNLGIDAAGNLYLLSYYVYNSGPAKAVTKLRPDGEISVLAGDLRQIDPRFERKDHLSADRAGNVYLAGTRSSVLKIAPDGTVTTFVRSAATALPYLIDGDAGTANLDHVAAIAAAPDGTLWVAESDGGYAERQIRRIDAQGQVTTLWRLRPTNYAAPLGGLAATASGELFVIDLDQLAILRARPGAAIDTFVGRELQAGYVDGPGPGARFSLKYNGRMAVQADGSVLVADVGNGAVRRIDKAAAVTTVLAYDTPPTGGLNGLTVAVDGQQRLHVLENLCKLYRREASGATVAILPASATNLFGGTCSSANVDGPPGTASITEIPQALVTDSSGGMLLATATCLRKIADTGAVSTFAGLCGTAGQLDARGTAARFSTIVSVAPLPDGAFLVLDQAGDYPTLRHVLRRVDAQGQVTTLRNLPFTNLRLVGDGRGTVLAITDDGFDATVDGIELWSGPDFQQSIRVVDIGSRTVLGPLPSTIERPTAVVASEGRLYLTVRNTVFSVDL